MKNDHIRKNNFLLLISFVGIVSVLLMEPLAQNQAYHEFADQRGYLFPISGTLYQMFLF